MFHSLKIKIMKLRLFYQKKVKKQEKLFLYNFNKKKKGRKRPFFESKNK